MTRDESDALYRVFVLHACEAQPQGKPSCAFSLLTLWERPWSAAALRFAYHALQSALTAGCDVLEVWTTNADGSPRYSAVSDTLHTE